MSREKIELKKTLYKEYNVTSRIYPYLLAIDALIQKESPSSIQQVSDVVKKTRQTAASVLKRLEDLGIIQNVPGANPSRKSFQFTEPTGQHVLETIKKIVEDK